MFWPNFIFLNVMRENVVFEAFQRTGGWCEPATITIQESLLNSKAES
ncbi:MAG: hypothetical protein H6Q68_3348 [Firmicutes bacterium]|nr:hypothetical protein [Bacillota bacterium]